MAVHLCVHTPYAGDLPLRAKIPYSCAPDHELATQRHLRFATGRLGVHLPPGAKILDFGCGIGSSVRVLLGLGHDAFGVDVLEYWGRDVEKYWHAAERQPAAIAQRLKLIDLSNYRLPFETGTFDFCFSDQVFEHVFDYATAMSEIVRVLKPGAISLHSFPGPNNFLEGHLRLPFPWLCYSRSYLTVCAWAAWLRGTESDWRRRVNDNVESMRFNNYPTKAKLRRIARATGVDISFVETDEFLFREGGRLKTEILKSLRAVGMDRVVTRIAATVMLQRYMLLKGR